MRVLLTAGGTREPIDDVRVVANSSTGRLGAYLADAFAEAGHEVCLLRGLTAASASAGSVRTQVFGSSVELWGLMERELSTAQIVLHAAAVADYVPLRASGKIPSDAEELVLRMVRAPKLIDRLRERAPDAVLVGFKLTSGADTERQVHLARALLQRARLDLVLANDASAIGEQDHRALLVSARSILELDGGKLALARALVTEVTRLGPQQEVSAS